MIQSAVDRLVEDYLEAVARACADLPIDVRTELLSDLREHIAAQRSHPTEADIRTILDRLGEPAAIAAEARVGEPPRPRPIAVPSPRSASTNTAVAVVVAGVLFTAFVLVIVAGLLVALFRA
jgi:uncharacterized membrane protein